MRIDMSKRRNGPWWKVFVLRPRLCPDCNHLLWLTPMYKMREGILGPVQWICPPCLALRGLREKVVLLGDTPNQGTWVGIVRGSGGQYAPPGPYAPGIAPNSGAYANAQGQLSPTNQPTPKGTRKVRKTAT